AFDLLAGCSGFLYALAAGSEFIGSGSYRNVLVVGTDTLSRVVDFADRSSCVLFGDGAGAAILSASGDPSPGLQHFRLYADGSKGDLLSLPAGGSRFPTSAQTVAAGLHCLKLKGREIYKFAVTRMQELIQEALADCRLSVDDVALLIPHQVNQRIIDSAVRHLKFPTAKVMVNL